MEQVYKEILLAGETLENRVGPCTRELYGFARALGSAPGRAALVLAGQAIREQAEKAAAEGVDVFAVEGEGFLYYNPPLLARELSRIVKQTGAGCVCLPHTMHSCAAAAQISVALGWPLITAVETVEASEATVRFSRSAYNGKIVEHIALGREENFVCTIQGGSFSDDGGYASGNGRAYCRSCDGGTSGFSPQGISGAEESGVSLSEADVIVAAGRGIGAEENLGIIYETARVFPNSAVGASRVVCDNGWLPYGHQVGMTGKTVSPRLYLACGISGSQQHVVGMKNSQFIVAVNSDPQAAIFSVAHVCVVDDLTLFLPVFVAKCREAREAG
ncbi:MAG TPA: electron transfer flavoprotein subunit alpha/FixB family protein [Spirochaetota bacterium]|nr:electron transfer flavoprotein subunit alpha/FixB family protein [Spirochaetota bacterium]HPI88003.1 electron transfer flavoprotein subunit alpha/FixB family protein [Spirochaetota bacterium]HPR46713.1 electron transfer flavoprotein subunit alpha/FixB family protein [Spirochaetota bacterium]